MCNGSTAHFMEPFPAEHDPRAERNDRHRGRDRFGRNYRTCYSRSCAHTPLARFSVGVQHQQPEQITDHPHRIGATSHYPVHRPGIRMLLGVGTMDWPATTGSETLTFVPQALVGQYPHCHSALDFLSRSFAATPASTLALDPMAYAWPFTLWSTLARSVVGE